MDALSETLRVVQLVGAIFLQGRFTAPWCYQSPHADAAAPVLEPTAERVVIFHLITEGECLVEMEGMPPLAVREGDVVLLLEAEGEAAAPAAPAKADAPKAEAAPASKPPVTPSHRAPAEPAAPQPALSSGKPADIECQMVVLGAQWGNDPQANNPGNPTPKLQRLRMQHLHQVQRRVRGRFEARIDKADVEVDFFGQWHHRQTAVLRHELVDQGNAHALFDQGHGFVGIGERQQ